MEFKSLKMLNLLITSCLITSLKLYAGEIFQKGWHEMQVVYKNLSATSINKLEHVFSHPYWLTTKKEIKNLITGSPNQDFFYNPDLQNAMIRSGFGAMQEYEIMHLKHCISAQTSQKLELFKETSFGSLPRPVTEFDCTINTLGHLYYASRVFESIKNQQLNTLVEFGSGFGNLARVFKMTHPEITLLLIDFPELLALQYFYLKSTLPHVNVIVHTSIPEHFTSGAIHLISVYSIEDINITADCFVSTFALSESTEYLQKIVAEKKFFGAQLCYITGQISGWGSLNFVDQSIILKSVRDQFSDVFCQPFHDTSSDFLTKLSSYDVLARTKVTER